MILEILLAAGLVSSLVVNLVFVWYTRNLLNYLEMTNDETRSILSSMASYETHLTEVYNKDVFYGEPILEKLLNHTSEMADEIQQFLEINEQLTTENPDA
jgi:uncharacterized membrane protein YgaE (UPF0421/DUF939 family)